MRSLVDRVYLMASGQTVSPATEGPAEIRWNCFADLYAHPRWGLVTIPGFTTAATHAVAGLCRATTLGPTADAAEVGGQVSVLTARWHAIDSLATIKSGRARSEVADYAWAAVSDSGIDAWEGRLQGSATGVAA